MKNDGAICAKLLFVKGILNVYVNWLSNFREGDRILDKIRRSDLGQIFNLTKCLKPCSYKKYSLLGDRKPSHFKSKYAAFSLWASSEKTRVETEQLIYPLSSLIAEFGGTLSLFLGFLLSLSRTTSASLESSTNMDSNKILRGCIYAWDRIQIEWFDVKVSI